MLCMLNSDLSSEGATVPVNERHCSLEHDIAFNFSMVIWKNKLNESRGPIYSHVSTSTWITNHMPSKVWDESTYQFPNFNGNTVEVWEGISNLISHFIVDMITYSC